MDGSRARDRLEDEKTGFEGLASLFQMQILRRGVERVFATPTFAEGINLNAFDSGLYLCAAALRIREHAALHHSPEK